MYVKLEELEDIFFIRKENHCNFQKKCTNPAQPDNLETKAGD